METQKLISIATEAGYEVVEYPGLYCVRGNVNLEVTVLIPMVPYIVKQLVAKIKAILGL